MEPLAVAAIASIAGAAVLAILIGAVSGAVAWRVRHGLVLGGLLSIGAYLAAQAAILLERTQVSGQVEKESWGKSIRALNPRVVYITNDGIYIQTGRGFVTEQGLFFPRLGTAMNGTTGTDPLYRALGNGIYWYEIKG